MKHVKKITLLTFMSLLITLVNINFLPNTVVTALLPDSADLSGTAWASDDDDSDHDSDSSDGDSSDGDSSDGDDHDGDSSDSDDNSKTSKSNKGNSKSKQKAKVMQF